MTERLLEALTDDAEWLLANSGELTDAVADLVGVSAEDTAHRVGQRRFILGTLRAIVGTIDAKDPYTCGHSDRVALLAGMMARELGLPAREVEIYRIAGFLHDFGKIGVPDRVLQKTGKLTDAEFALVKQHPALGCAILKDLPPLEATLGGVRHHHERWDGRGYPGGLRGEAIPQLARVLAVADTFDAMSSDRAYRSKFPRAVVLAEIRRAAGSQFDPALAETFLSLDLRPYDALVQQGYAQEHHLPAGIA